MYSSMAWVRRTVFNSQPKAIPYHIKENDSIYGAKKCGPIKYGLASFSNKQEMKFSFIVQALSRCLNIYSNTVCKVS